MTGARTDDEILDLVAGGASLDELATFLQVTPRRAATVLKQVVKRTLKLKPSAETDRLLELRSLELVRRAMTPHALRGDTSAARVLVRVAEAKARLLQPGSATGQTPTASTGGREGDELARLRSQRRGRLTDPVVADEAD